MRVVLEEVCEVSEVFLTVNISVEAVELVRDGPVVVLEFVCKVTEVFLEVLEAGANFIGSDKRTCAREDRLMAGKKELSLQFRYAQFGYVGDFSLFKHAYRRLDGWLVGWLVGWGVRGRKDFEEL